MKSWSLTALAALAVAALSVPGVLAQEPTSQPAAAASAYPLKVCVIAEHDLGEEPVTETIDGREVRFCCAGCIEDFKKDTAASHKKMDEMIVAAQKESYPLTTCAVADEPLGSMGEPVMYVHRPTNRLVKLCCSGCIKTVNRDSARILAKIDAASAAAPVAK